MENDTLKHGIKEKLTLFLTSLAAIALIIENLVMGWEIWAPAVLIIMIILLWTVHFSKKLDPDWKAFFCFLVAFLIVFYHGVHESSFFDNALVVAFAMVAYASFNRKYMLHLFLVEFLFLMAWHLFNIAGWTGIEFTALNISRILLHIVIIIFVYIINLGRSPKDWRMRKRTAGRMTGSRNMMPTWRIFFPTSPMSSGHRSMS